MKYYIIAGEASGDLHGSNLIKKIIKKDSECEIRAWGGDKMLNAGAVIARHYKDHNFMGFTEVIIHLNTILQNFKFCKKDIIEFNPDVVIFIDFPGFNLRIAKWAKQHHFKTVYYISPQIWAWKSSRVYTIRKVIDKMITILPFEKDFYKKFDVDVEYVGHPLLDAIHISENNQSDKTKNQITLLPGSRIQEIKRMLPVMTMLPALFPQYEFVIAGASNIGESIYHQYSVNKIPVKFNMLYQLLNQSKAAVVTSGTATLETALNNVPMIVCYKSTELSYQIAKKLIRVKFISLVNLIMDKMVVTELIQNDMNIKKLKEELHSLIFHTEKRQEMFEDFKELKTMLGNSGASDRAAQIIVDMIKR